MPEELPPLEEFTETVIGIESEKPTEAETITEVVSSPPSEKLPIPPATDINIKKLGYYLDGWADLIEYKGNESDPVLLTIIDILNKRFSAVPANRHEIAVSNVTYNKGRDYISQHTWPGATTTIYVGPRGEDLYVAWRSFIKPVTNFKVIAAIVFAGLVLGALARDNGGDATIFVIFASLGILLSSALVALVGKVDKGDSNYYFYEETSIFHAEDITAMNMAVHKSILRALDKRGIDVKQLRLKQDFVGGRRDEKI